MKNIFKVPMMMTVILLLGFTTMLTAQMEVSSKMYSKEIKGVILKAEALADLNVGAYKALSVIEDGTKDIKITAGKGYKMLRAKNGSVLVTRGNEFKSATGEKSKGGFLYIFCTGCDRQLCQMVKKFGKFVGSPRGGAKYYVCKGCNEDGTDVPCELTLLIDPSALSGLF